MEFLYLLATMAALSRYAVSGRAVNVSGAWFLPEDGFPVFYRYFDDKLTWNEARAACSSHHADLLSVQTSARMDAARAYLKEMEVADSVWIGLRKDSTEEGFSWTDGEKLVGDGYWVEPIPKSTEGLCVATEPGADFRWNSHHCSGPEVAGFVCELAVPEWAKKENGCLTSSLPSLTVTLMPEAGVIQLLSDCGLNGTRRTACDEKTDLQEIIRRLSCDLDAFARSTTAAAARELNTKPSSSSDTTRPYHLLTRHRRSATPTSPPSPSPSPSHLPNPPNQPPPTPIHPAPTYKPLPVLIITAQDFNQSLPSSASDSPPILFIIQDNDLHGPFLFPVPDDLIINNPSRTPLQITSVDLLHLDNLTPNNTNNQTTPTNPSIPPPPLTPHHPPHTPTTQLPPATLDPDAPQTPNRPRTLTRPARPSFYPRLLNRLLG